MPFLIDGNNLLFAARDVEDPDRLVGRAMLCERLGLWARRGKQRVHVIFDGPAPAEPLAQQIAGSDIRVTYSGHGVSADAALIRTLEEDSAARRLFVVSTDREIAAAARRRRATPIRSDVFWKQVRRDLARPESQPLEPPEKLFGLTPEQAADWARELGLDSPAGNPPAAETPRRERPPPRRPRRL